MKVRYGRVLLMIVLVLLLSIAVIFGMKWLVAGGSDAEAISMVAMIFFNVVMLSSAMIFGEKLGRVEDIIISIFYQDKRDENKSPKQLETSIKSGNEEEAIEQRE